MKRTQLFVALICMAALGPLQADELGRLFSTPAERARIDDLRAGQPIITPAVDSSPDHRVLNGVLRGSNGKRLVWVNGSPVNPDSRDVTVLQDGRARMSWQDGQAARTLKPGQRLDTRTGAVYEQFEHPVGHASAEH